MSLFKIQGVTYYYYINEKIENEIGVPRCFKGISKLLGTIKALLNTLDVKADVSLKLEFKFSSPVEPNGLEIRSYLKYKIRRTSDVYLNLPKNLVIKATTCLAFDKVSEYDRPSPDDCDCCCYSPNNLYLHVLPRGRYDVLVQTRFGGIT